MCVVGCPQERTPPNCLIYCTLLFAHLPMSLKQAEPFVMSESLSFAENLAFRIQGYCVWLGGSLAPIWQGRWNSEEPRTTRAPGLKMIYVEN